MPKYMIQDNGEEIILKGIGNPDEKLPRYGVWTLHKFPKDEIVEAGNDLKYLITKYDPEAIYCRKTETIKPLK
jgi:hypothetical protein